MNSGDVLPPAQHSPTRVQLFRFSAATWNAHRIHFDAEYAREEGYPDVLVQSHLHASLLARFVLEWAGEGAELVRFRWANRAIAIPGDTLTYNGSIESVEADGPRLRVSCDLTVTNQRGELCVTGGAEVLRWPARGAEAMGG